MSASRKRVAVDIGGTFVDAIVYDEDSQDLRIYKVSTTPDEPARGVLDSVAGLVDDVSAVAAFAHGTTLGLNAILQRSGADVGILTNDGFSDLLEVARAAIPTAHMYDFSYARPAPLVPRRYRRGVVGRMDAQGREVTPLDRDGLMTAARELIEDHGLRSIAICFLHSYANPEHEREAGALLRREFPGVEVSISSDLTREYREYERTSTVMLDAYIRPVLNNYIAQLESRLGERGLTTPLHIMRSGGGAMTAELAKSAPLMTVLSGPAGGVVGGSFLARELRIPNLLSFDVGGTSVDACVIQDGSPSEVYEATIDSLPLMIPIFDIRTIGAGGGSIASVDGGLLKVGPRSAGAVPGPVAYGAGGTEPTVTDAAFVLGYLDPSAFLDGAMTVDRGAALDAIHREIAEPLGLDDTDAAASIFRVLLARTVNALREVTIERALDPREFTLLAFGGAGPLMGPMLAREMGIETTLIPSFPAAFSAYGMLMSDLEYEFAATSLTPLVPESLRALAHVFDELTEQAEAIMEQQRVPAHERKYVRILDVRYTGQEHALPVELTDEDTAASVLARFNELHLKRHGHAMKESAQILALRLKATGIQSKPTLKRLPTQSDSSPTPSTTRAAYDIASGSWTDFAIYERQSLLAGQRIAGPAIVQEGTSTTVFFRDQELIVNEYGHLVISQVKEVPHA
jgi:N-methylhydantoinase A